MNYQIKTLRHILTILLISLSTVVLSRADIHKTLRLACEGTSDPTECSSGNVPNLIAVTLNKTISDLHLCSSNFSDLQSRLGSNLTFRDQGAFDVCHELFNETIFNLNNAISDLQSTSQALDFDTIQALISGAMTSQDTCLDAFARSQDEFDTTYGVLANHVTENVLNISNHLSNSLNLFLNIPLNLTSTSKMISNDVQFPVWLSATDQEIIQNPEPDGKFNLVVAKDGTGNYKTIGEAVSAAPNSSKTRFVIYIKSGVYFENVEIPQKKTMIMFVGDGIGKTVIKGNRNDADGFPTYRTATVAAVGTDFVAKGISFINYAGPTKNQAVAFRSSSDRSVFYRCSFEGYQDTLYVDRHRQFYRECDIYGTVDFIFGNAAVVLQNCNIYARKPNPYQKITITAQGREEPNMKTGISIINSRILAASDLIPVKSMFKAYLGRPWRLYSRTVFIKSYIDDIVDPAGWLEWNDDFALDSLYYGEHMNYGPGSSLVNRVNWSGFRRIESAAEASQFTVGPFIDGDNWIRSTGVPFNLGF